MKNFIGTLTSITFVGTVIYCLRLIMKNYIKNNPTDVLDLLFEAIDFFIVQAIKLIEGILRLTL